jgi:kumamolisin
MRRTVLGAGGAALTLTLIAGLAFGGQPAGTPGASAATAAGPAGPVEAGPLAGGAPVDLGPADPSLVLQVGLALRGRDPAGLQRAVEEQSDPTAPGHGLTWTPQALGDRFGLPAADEDQLVALLEAAGLSVTGRVPQRSSLRVTGTVADLQRVLGLQLRELGDPRTGRSTVGTLEAPTVPPSLAGAVTAILGLDPYLPVSTVAPDEAPAPPVRGLGPRDLAVAYDFLPLWEAGFDGAGQSIAILQFGVDTDEDLAVYDAAFGLQGPPVERIEVGEGLANAPADFAVEAALDTQVVRGTAPGADILVFGFGVRESMATAVDTIVADGRAKMISLSYGKCFLPGEYMFPAEVEAGNDSFARAALAGVSLYAASGDWGAFSCHVFNKEEHRESTFWPSCTDNVVSVGGTFLETRQDGTHLRETGWQDYLTTGGTGGGFSPTDARPAWQTGPGVDTSDDRRACPDVAAAADPDTGYLIFVTDQETGEAGWQMIGGTSAAAPLWAGIQALMQQAAAAQGVESFGFVTPRYYRIAATDPDAFYDVTRGGNLVHVSGPGWDAATGVGTPRTQALLDALIADIQANP